MTSRKLKTVPTDPVSLRPGWLIIDTSHAGGGVKYDRTDLKEERDGEVLRSEFITRKKIDNVKVVEEIDALVKRASYICKANCVNTVVGWIADDAALAKITAEFAALRGNADELNRLSERLGSRHRAHVAFVPAFLDVSNPAAASEIARTIRASLGAILSALRAGDITDTKLDGKIVKRQTLRPAMIHAKNLDKLAVGIAGECLKDALDRAAGAKEEIRLMIKQGSSPEQAGKAVDLDAIETAITWFTEAP